MVEALGNYTTGVRPLSRGDKVHMRHCSRTNNWQYGLLNEGGGDGERRTRTRLNISEEQTGRREKAETDIKQHYYQYVFLDLNFITDITTTIITGIYNHCNVIISFFN